MLRLNRISAQGFKSIRELDNFRLRGLNVLIGANGAGKSNFLALLRMMAAMMDRNLQLFVAKSSGPDALLSGGLKHTERVWGKFVFASTTERITCRFSLVPAGDRLVFEREWLWYDGDMEWLRSAMLDYLAHLCEAAGPDVADIKEFEHEDLPTIGREAGYDLTHLEPGIQFRSGSGHKESETIDFLDHVLSPIAEWRRYHFADTGSTSRIRQAQRVRDNLRLQEDGGNLGPVLRDLHEHHPHQYREIVQTVRLAAPFFGDFVHRERPGERAMLEWTQAGNPDHVLGTNELSDGTLRFICLATLLLQPDSRQPDLMMIEEPELGLHPFAVTLLAEMLEAAGGKRQLVVSTQSAELVSHLAPEDVIVVDRRDGASTFKRLDSALLADWLEDYSLGALWQMGVVGGRPSS